MADQTADAEPDGPAEPDIRDEDREAILAVFQEHLGDAVLAHHIRPKQGLWIRVATDAWATAAEVASKRADLRFFDFLNAIDWLPSPFGRYEDSELDVPFPPPMPDRSQVVQGYTGGDTRFQVLASVSEVSSGQRVLLKADVPDDSMTVPTWTHVYAGASWHERETREMFGISFAGNPDERNLYLPSGFEGHPLRKEFPLLARVVKPWPGIVDVEPMPGGDDEEAEEATEGADA